MKGTLAVPTGFTHCQVWESWIIKITPNDEYITEMGPQEEGFPKERSVRSLTCFNRKNGAGIPVVL